MVFYKVELLCFQHIEKSIWFPWIYLFYTPCGWIIMHSLWKIKFFGNRLTFCPESRKTKGNLNSLKKWFWCMENLPFMFKYRVFLNMYCFHFNRTYAVLLVRSVSPIGNIRDSLGEIRVTKTVWLRNHPM